MAKRGIDTRVRRPVEIPLDGSSGPTPEVLAHLRVLEQRRQRHLELLDGVNTRPRAGAPRSVIVPDEALLEEENGEIDG